MGLAEKRLTGREPRRHARLLSNRSCPCVFDAPITNVTAYEITAVHCRVEDVSCHFS
jgi:hypothetical protein